MLAIPVHFGQSGRVVEGGDGVVRVRFQLDQDEDGWPPVGSEGVWAEPLGDDQYRIRNTPWFVLNLAYEDVVAALADGDGVLWAMGERIWSGRMTVRVIPFRAGPLGGDRQAVLDAFEPFGVTGEGTEEWGIVALDIPPDADLAAVKRELREGQADGRWDYDEGCVSEAWISL